MRPQAPRPGKLAKFETMTMRNLAGADAAKALEGQGSGHGCGYGWGEKAPCIHTGSCPVLPPLGHAARVSRGPPGDEGPSLPYLEISPCMVGWGVCVHAARGVGEYAVHAMPGCACAVGREVTLASQWEAIKAMPEGPEKEAALEAFKAQREEELQGDA